MDCGIPESSWKLQHTGDPFVCNVKKSPPKRNLDGDNIYTYFSHVEWHMKAFYMECMEQQAKDLRWVTLEELKQEIAIPSAFAPFKDLLNSGV